VKAEHHSPGSGFIGPEQVAQIVHEWHVLAGSVLVARGTGNVVYQFITKALQRYTNDPDLHLALGIYFERDANDGVVDVSLVRDIYMPETVSSWRGALESAVDHYEEALKTESSLEEAQLRLGRVDTLLGERRKAEAALTPLATGARNPSIRYLALLFLAELADAQGRREPAQSRYLEALVLYPEAQAPMLALSCLQDQAGDDVGARAWLERSLNAVNSKRLDPWWLYGKAPVSRFNDMIGALRKYLRP
jgi:tetratricopeptide (TPR) repeat protein